MNKVAVLTGIICFLSGISGGILFASKPLNIDANSRMLTKMTSQGRAEIQKALPEIARVLKEDTPAIYAEETMLLQAITAQAPDCNAAEFHLFGLEDKRKAAQTKIDKILLDAIERMPLMDRQTYMKFHLRNRFYLKMHSIVLPLIVTTETNDKAVGNPS